MTPCGYWVRRDEANYHFVSSADPEPRPTKNEFLVTLCGQVGFVIFGGQQELQPYIWYAWSSMGVQYNRCETCETRRVV